ncbi:MAG: hypothetical protein HQ506_09855 [Candidatus Marinimicrobia bacterium]|nr:hypothetical protein [Candidatus Neomarinimicrobiota bacterium]
MGILDKAFLVGSYLVAMLAIWSLRNKKSVGESRPPSDYYHGIAFGVLGIASLLLSIFGWGILGIMGEGTSNKLVAIVSSLIPFSWGMGLISRFYPRYEKFFLALMILGLGLITLSRFMDAPLMARIVYPVFHSTAALVVIATPIIMVKKGLMNFHFLTVSIGGAIISAAGISLAFLSAGRQLLFFSQAFVLMIFGPLLFTVVILYFWGLIRGEKS